MCLCAKVTIEGFIRKTTSFQNVSLLISAGTPQTGNNIPAKIALV
jgi:hypothetical protein